MQPAGADKYKADSEQVVGFQMGGLKRGGGIILELVSGRGRVEGN